MLRFTIDARRLLNLLGFLVALLIAMPAFALTTGDLRGTVTDEEDGLPIPGVSITLTGDTLIGGAQEKTTDANGTFQFTQLPPGSYQLTATKGGFQSVTVTGLSVDVNRTTIQNVALPVAGGEEIVVEGSKNPVDVEDTTRGEVLTKEFLQRIPVGRSYQSAVQMAAGVTGGANPNMGGSSFNENTYMLDGANITDPVTGTFSLNFNYDALQQIEVLLGGYEPEYGVSLGGVINLVTETGTNNLQFDTSVFYNNGDWRPRMDARYTADGYQLAPTGFDTTFQLLRVSAKVSGPIIRDRAWFIVSYQHSRSLIANTGIPQPRDFDGHYVLGKLTIQPSSEHRFTTFLQLDPTAIDNTNQSTIFQKPEAQGRQAQGGFVTQARWQWFLSPDANLDTQVVVQKTFIEVNAVPCTHNRDLGYHPCKADEEEGFIDWETPGRLGLFGAYDSVNYGYFYFDDRLRYQATSKLSVLSWNDPWGGSHDFKVGTEAIQTVWDQVQGYSGNTLYYDLNEIAFDPETFKNYYWLEITGPIKFRTTGSQWNFFVQDAYKPIPNLTLKYGVRFDNTVMRNDIGEPVVSGSLWGPRAYAAWDPFGDQKTKIAGGYGRFNDTGRLSVASFTSVNSYGSKLFLGEFFGGQLNETGGGFVNSQNLMYDWAPRENLNSAHDTIRMPRVDEVILTVEREVLEDIKVGTFLSGKFTRFSFEYDETNIIYDEDGSAIIGARDGNQLINRFRLRTPALAMRDYFQGDFYIDKVLSRRWFGRVTYSYISSLGTSSTALSGSFSNDPQTQYNYGRFAATDIRHQVKGYAAWQLPTDPWEQTLGMTLTYLSGNPLERLYYNDEDFGYSLRIRDRGIYYRFPPNWFINFKFTQDLDVRKGTVQLDLEVQNILNNRAPYNFSSVFYTQNRLLTTTRQDPIRIQLGLRYQF